MTLHDKSPSAARIGAALFILLPGLVHAHSFGKVYSLPVPVWLYLYGAAAALVLSFVIVGYFVNAKNVALNQRSLLLTPLDRPWIRIGLSTARVISVAVLALTISSGWLGVQNAYDNISMTMFWIIFVLGFTYLTALTGNSFAYISPWVVLCDWLDRLRPGLLDGRFSYRRSWAYWPALLLYGLFIWIELFGRTKPWSLSLCLTVYTGLNLVAAWVWGRQAWFRYGEFFGVFLRIVGMMAPLQIQRDAKTGVRQLALGQPFVGLTRRRVTQFSLMVFVLFMLSSTAFDGIKSTVPYVRIYWVHVAAWLKPMLGGDIVAVFPTLKAIYAYWQIGALALSPFLYLAVYLFFVWLCKLIARSDMGVVELGCRFAYSLVPIAFVYHLTHYYALLLSQGGQVLKLASDPFGWGWNLFGTAATNFNYIPQTGTIWHTQVWLILAGHIISVYLAHMEALKIFGDSKRAALSQIPMLLLMVALTTVGLWILSLPISGGQ